MPTNISMIRPMTKKLRSGSGVYRHINILIRHAQSLKPDARNGLMAELKLKSSFHATFAIGDEIVVAVFNITQYQIARLVEHYHIAYDRESDWSKP